MSSAENKFGKLAISGANQGAAMSDATNLKPKSGKKDLAAAQMAKEKGWVEPHEYDYKVYNMTGEEARAAGAKAAEARLAAEAAGELTLDIPTWAANAGRYEWNDEYGDVGPAFPELEQQLFKDELTNRIGENVEQLKEINVTVESETKIKPVAKFEDAGLHPVMLENVKLCGYKKPTPIQAYCLPAILLNHDVIGIAKTGSGKTAAFFIPTISKLMGKAKKIAAPRPNLTTVFDERTDGICAEPLLLVIVPTRELAVQIFDEARRLCYRSMLRPCVVYGGAPAREQITELRKGCDVLIATPGRLMDFLQRRSMLTLQRVRYTIIDEADEMVGPDWADEMKILMSGADNNIDTDHLYMMFSATFPKEARQLAREHMADDHIRIRIGRAGSTHSNIAQNVVFVEPAKKEQALYDLLMSMPPSRTLVFVNNKKAADLLDYFVHNHGLPSTSIHADRTQREREDALRAFKSGKAPIMIATGVSARGLDIKNVMHIINYDLPSASHGGIDEYVHRIGRTGRIGNDGAATSFYNDRDSDLAPSLVKVLIESGQDVPDFLQEYKPEGANLDFDDDTDNEGEEEAETAKPPIPEIRVTHEEDSWSTPEVDTPAKEAKDLSNPQATRKTSGSPYEAVSRAARETRVARMEASGRLVHGKVSTDKITAKATRDPSPPGAW